MQGHSSVQGDCADLSPACALKRDALQIPFAIFDCLQVLETRAELDSLEELANCPMVARRAEKYSAFFAAAPEMLQSTRSVADFERRLVELLFPEATYLHCLAIAH